MCLLEFKFATCCMSPLIKCLGELYKYSLLSPFFCSRICPARSMTSPRGLRPVWAQPSAPAAPPAAAAAARGSREAPATRDSPPSPRMPPHISPARGAGPLPPLLARLRAPLSPSSPDLALDPSLPPVDPLPTPPLQVGLPLEPLKVCAHES